MNECTECGEPFETNGQCPLCDMPYDVDLTVIRATGSVVCPECSKPWREHPVDPQRESLRVGCTPGLRLKL